MYVVSEILNGYDIKGKIKFHRFEALKTYLIHNTEELFGWINERYFNSKRFYSKTNDVDDKDYHELPRELPNFRDVETVSDINTILDKYNYGWWFITVETIEEE